MKNELITVGLGEVHISKNPSCVLVCYGLGSCIGVAMYDAVTRVAAMAHIVLPDSAMARAQDCPAKFADTCIPTMLNLMEHEGAKRANLIIKLAGGAQVLTIPGGNSRLDVGNRNIEAIQQAMVKANLRPVSTDLGGNFGRTMQLYVDGGKVTIRTIGQPEHPL